MSETTRLTHAEILQLQRWNTPTVYNGWEQVTKRDSGRECFNLEEIRDFTPELGFMAGRAITVVCQPGNPEPQKSNPNAWKEYLSYAAEVPGPKIVVVQDLDKPHTYGAFWGEVNAGIHRALGCAGTIMDGAVRDLAEMRGLGFKTLARRQAVGHAYSCPVRWGCEVEVFGVRIRPGQLIHADGHGFLAIPPEDEAGLLEAIPFLDRAECKHLIAPAREGVGPSQQDFLRRIERGFAGFRQEVHGRFEGRKGEH